MARPSPLSEPLRETTLDDPPVEPARRGGERGLRVVVLWHPDPRRIGAAAWVPWPGPGANLDFSRQHPLFDDGEPLGDTRVSRSPLQVLAVPGGAEVWPGRDGLRFDVDGQRGLGREAVTQAALQRGVRLGLGRGALLDLRLGPPFRE